jgi:rhodanese-related sulfurtransferase
VQLIDVRSLVERKISSIKNSRLIPLGQLSNRLSELDPQRVIVLYSREDKQSTLGVKILLDAGFSNVKVLRGGINAWSREIDPTLYQY